MAEQTYDLTQTGQQVQNIINDANKVMGAGSQTTLTTESIILKDTSGNYHKIDKSSFAEAIRNTLANLLVNNDKGTTLSQIIAINNGDLGSVSPNNLASVLGATITMSEAVFSQASVSRGGGSETSYTIPRNARQSILICTLNGPTVTPSIFVLGRTSIAAALYEGSAVKQSNLSVDSETGNITVTKTIGTTLYYRLIYLEA